MSTTQRSEPRRTALVLSGGGSRGAYEVGVLHYMRTALAKRLGSHLNFDIISGTSVGAINASYLAATAADPDRQIVDMLRLWRGLRIEDLISLSTRDLLRAGRSLLATRGEAPKGGYRHGGVLETSGLERFVLQSIPWRAIRRNLNAGALKALTVSATHVGTGHTMVFIDSAAPVPSRWSSDPFIRHVRAPIGPRHALASAAIPMLFPAVRLGSGYYVDGGLRHNTPLSPPIRLGADRIIVVSLRYHRDGGAETQVQTEREAAYPSPVFLMGKALNALMLDHTAYDLERLRRINSIIDAGKRAFGERFEEVLSDELVRLRGAPVRPVEVVHIRPSQDIGALASDFMSAGGPALRSRVARRLFHRLGRSEASHESDLLSYFLFDGKFASKLIELGYADAEAQADELAELVS